MNWRLLATALCVGLSAACAVVVSFDGFDRQAPGGDAGISGFKLVAAPNTLSQARDSVQTLEVRVLREPGFQDEIVFSQPTSSSALVELGTTTDRDRLVVTVSSRVPLDATLTFQAHNLKGDRQKSLDVGLVVRGGSGDLDPAFGDGGILRQLEAIDDCFGVTARDGGVIVATHSPVKPEGEQQLRAWGVDGRPSAGFGDGGVVSIQRSLGQGLALTRSEGGGLFVAGMGPSSVPFQTQPLAHEFLSNGQRDPGFADGGAVPIDLDVEALATDGPDVIAVGAQYPAGVLSARRISAQGVLDNGFGSGGTLALGDLSVSACARLVSGTLVVGAVRMGTEAPLGPLVRRFTPQGTTDLGSNYAGAALPTGWNGPCTVRSDGSVVFAEVRGLAVLSGASSVDYIASTFFSTTAGIADVAADPKGRVLVLGALQGALAVARFLADGNPDLSFHSPGLAYGVQLPFPAGSSARVAAAPDASVYVVWEGSTELAILRLLP